MNLRYPVSLWFIARRYAVLVRYMLWPCVSVLPLLCVCKESKLSDRRVRTWCAQILKVRFWGPVQTWRLRGVTVWISETPKQRGSAVAERPARRFVTLRQLKCWPTILRIKPGPSTPATMSKQQETLSKLRSTLSKQHSTLLPQTATMSNVYRKISFFRQSRM